MLKFLLIVLLISFVVRRILPWLLRWLIGQFVSQQAARAGYGPAPRSQPAPEGQVRVDYVPPRQRRQPRPGGYRGGEYVEFEEVK